MNLEWVCKRMIVIKRLDDIILGILKRRPVIHIRPMAHKPSCTGLEHI